jgi:hypothetical protein
MIQQYFVDKLRFIFFKIFRIENLKFLSFWKFLESNNLWFLFLESWTWIKLAKFVNMRPLGNTLSSTSQILTSFGWEVGQTFWDFSSIVKLSQMLSLEKWSELPHIFIHCGTSLDGFFWGKSGRVYLDFHPLCKPPKLLPIVVWTRS